MTQLSSETRAVLSAVDALYEEDIPHDYCIMAAALRAAASQFDRPKRSDAHALWNEGFQHAQRVCRANMLAIATELEGSNA